jgi:uncharacterized membrane protein YjjP (DUF1212 family)
MTNLRYAGYLLVAMGLINMRYQTGHSNIVTHSLVIVIPGLLLLAATFNKSTQKILAGKNAKICVGIVAASLVAYSFINN